MFGYCTDCTDVHCVDAAAPDSSMNGEMGGVGVEPTQNAVRSGSSQNPLHPAHCSLAYLVG